MKNKFLGLLIFLFALVSVVSCTTEPLDEGIEPIDPITNDGSFSVQFSNSIYSTNNVSASAIQGAITITAENNTGAFVILIEGDEQGTYSNDEVSITYINTSGEMYSSFAGQEASSNLTISTINYQQKKISGTFGFTGVKLSPTGEPTTETMVFTQGVFTNVSVTGNLVNPNPEEPEEPEEPQSGNYFPMAIGNIWNYTNSLELEIYGTKVIENKTYYIQYNHIFYGILPVPYIQEFLREEAGNYYARYESFSNSQYPMQQPVEFILLKDYLDEGETWTDNYSTSYSFYQQGEQIVVNINATRESVIEQKYTSLTVNGVDYQDVIKVKTIENASYLWGGQSGNYNTEIIEIWFAKNIGIIKLNLSESETSESYELTDYNLN